VRAGDGTEWQNLSCHAHGLGLAGGDGARARGIQLSFPQLPNIINQSSTI
jgi:hypothetical protein